MNELEQLLTRAKKGERIVVRPHFKAMLKERILSEKKAEKSIEKEKALPLLIKRLSILLVPALVSISMFFYFYDTEKTLKHSVSTPPPTPLAGKMTEQDENTGQRVTASALYNTSMKSEKKDTEEYAGLTENTDAPVGVNDTTPVSPTPATSETATGIAQSNETQRSIPPANESFAAKSSDAAPGIGGTQPVEAPLPEDPNQKRTLRENTDGDITPTPTLAPASPELLREPAPRPEDISGAGPSNVDNQAAFWGFLSVLAVFVAGLGTYLVSLFNKKSKQ